MMLVIAHMSFTDAPIRMHVIFRRRQLTMTQRVSILMRAMTAMETALWIPMATVYAMNLSWSGARMLPLAITWKTQQMNLEIALIATVGQNTASPLRNMPRILFQGPRPTVFIKMS